MTRLLAEPALWLAVNLAALAVVSRRRVYRCRCHRVRLGSRRDRRVHDDGPKARSEGLL
jgi:hypothetical protein